MSPCPTLRGRVVSILIVLDISLEGVSSPVLGTGLTPVSILIVLDISLEVPKTVQLSAFSQVSILIVLDISLEGFFFINIHNY